MENNGTIPVLRNDISAVEYEIDGISQYVLSDPYGIAQSNVSIAKEFFKFLNALEEGFTFKELKEEIQNDEVFSMICESIEYLDECGYLVSNKFLAMSGEAEAEYQKVTERPMITAGASYPAASDDFKAFAAKYFSSHDIKFDKNIKALILPHIDFSIGNISTDIYSKGYSSIADKDYDLFVIFGTSHRAFSDYLMFSEKDYLTPLGKVEIDNELLENLKVRLNDEITIDDYAHRFEHSIEFQAVLLKYYFQNKNFKILPILVSSPYPFIMNNEYPNSDDRSNRILEVLKEEIEKSGRKTFYIASVDFAHIGRKFGDNYDAEEKIDQLKLEDKQLIESIENGDNAGFFKKILLDKDKWKICGNSSIYSLMQMLEPKSGKLIDYAIWNEQAAKSAVSFASIALFDEE